MSVTLGLLMSSGVRVLHQRKRTILAKKIVEHGNHRYIVVRFRQAAVFERYVRLLEEMREAGVSVQPIIDRTTTPDQIRLYGHCLTLGYLLGDNVGRKPAGVTVASLGRNLARLHSIEGPEGTSLFLAPPPQLPHGSYLFWTRGLRSNERSWIRNSQARLRRLKANHLTHGDLHRGNIIKLPDETTSLIDYERMVFDRAGIEFAVALIRLFANGADRKALSDSYLSYCGKAQADLWTSHGVDFLFAAAARLSMRRKRRTFRLSVTNAILRVLAHIPWRRQHRIRSRLDANRQNILVSKRQHEYFAHIARGVVREGIDASAESSLELLARIDAEFHEKLVAEPRPSR